MHQRRTTLGALTLAALLTTAGAATLAPERVEFARDIRPILAERCWSCHGSGEQKAGLRLDSRPAALKGGRSGPALKPGSAAGSELLRRITSHDPQMLMPPGRPLQPAEVALFRSWIDSGAEWPQGAAQSAGPHWAFVSPKRPAVPAVKNRAWVKNPIDAFILAEQEKKGLTPSPPADRETLIRRVTLDLTGLPPTPEEVATFVKDPAADAYEKVVRRLLASPHYGERWAQHWLDVVRFAETNGFELDGDRPQAWRYRDYVVRALNEDRPYDRFLKEQIAGDEFDPKSFELRVATGFLRAGPRHVVGGNVDPAVDRQEWLTEAVAGIGNGVMGLTIGCARCHDHKFDPIPQADYYRLQAFLAGTEDAEVPFATAEEKAAFEKATAALKERAKPIQARISEIEAPVRARLRQEKLDRLEAPLREALESRAERRTPEQKKLAAIASVQVKLEWTEVVAALTPADRERRAALRKQLHALDLEAPEPPPMAPGVKEREKDKIPPTHLLVRGDPHTPGEEVQFQYPRAVQFQDDDPGNCGLGIGALGRRTRLADWLTRPRNPLTSRVIVNRLWKHHFGRGLVATPNDFGRNGARPTHPALLDYLAARFAELDYAKQARIERVPQRVRGRDGMGWSLKQMHYLMVTSATYRQSSAPPVQKTRTGAISEAPLFQTMLKGDPSMTHPAPSRDRQEAGGRLPYPDRRHVANESRLEATKRDIMRHPDPSQGRQEAGARFRVSDFPAVPTPYRVAKESRVEATKRDITRHGVLARASFPVFRSVDRVRDGGARAAVVSRVSLPENATKRDITRHAAPAGGETAAQRNARIDPQNLFFWRQNPQRLDAEALRDSVLAASGALNPQAGGPPVRVPLEPEVYDQIFTEGEPDNLWPVTPDLRQHTRRSLYLLRKRNVRLPMLAVFDQPDMLSSCGARGESVHALQALTLMNSDFMLAQSRALARRILTESGGDPAKALDRLYRVALSRPPRPEEIRRAKGFLRGQAEVIAGRIAAGEPVTRLEGVKVSPAEAAAWADLCLATLNLNEFVYVR